MSETTPSADTAGKFLRISTGLTKMALALAVLFVAIGAMVWLIGHKDVPSAIASVQNVEADFKKPTLISQDATRRVIVTTERPGSPGIPSVPAIDDHPAIPEVPGTGPSLVTCTEPSPDALSAISASVAATGGLSDQAAAALQAGLRQSVAGIGLRTQSIQMLRDQGFRLCEGYASGAIDKLDYRQLLRRNQVFTTAILAIEQLTSTVRAEQATIVPSDEAGKANLMERAQNLITRQEELDRTLKDNGDVAKAKPGDMVAGRNVDQAAITAAAEKISLAQKAVDDAIASVHSLASLETSADSRTEAARIGGAVSSEKGGNSSDIVKAVQRIVLAAFTKTFMADFCQMYWGRSIGAIEAMGDEYMSRERRNIIENTCNTSLAAEAQYATALYGVTPEAANALAEKAASTKTEAQPPGR